MEQSFTRATLGNTGIQVHRLGLSASYRPSVRCVHKALDAGINFFFGYGLDTQLIRVLREFSASERERYVVATGAYNLGFSYTDLRKTLEKRLRQLRTDYIDVFMFLGVLKPEHFPERVREELYRLREEGKVRSVAISCHDQEFVGRLAAEGALDVVMMRYNAAHRGAEERIFPFVGAHNPGVVSYTATRWGMLLRRPRGWSQEARRPTARMCYRFVLSNPHVHVCLTAPSTIEQFEENLAALEAGPLDEQELAFMREFGDSVNSVKRWFM
ncbi:MAG: aldo/keto reductase [bacterium]|nr:aldo/keto reductase [bacterium]